MRLKVGVVYLLVCIFCLYSCGYRRPIQAERTGNDVVISFGNHTISGHLVGGESTAIYMLVGGTGRGLFPFTAHFSVVSSVQLQRFEREYGSFLEAKSNGVLESSGNVFSMFLYAEDESVARVLHEADDLAMLWRYPLVKLTCIEFRIDRHTVGMMGRKVEELSFSDYQPNYFVTSAEIIKRNYP